LTLFLLTYLFGDKIGFNYFTLMLFMFILSLIFQLMTFKKENPSSCLRAFKVNNFSGLLMFVSILLY
jgi:4-hydroxybenzoate polyprenyltransferase